MAERIGLGRTLPSKDKPHSAIRRLAARPRAPSSRWNRARKTEAENMPHSANAAIVLESRGDHRATWHRRGTRVASAALGYPLRPHDDPTSRTCLPVRARRPRCYQNQVLIRTGRYDRDLWPLGVRESGEPCLRYFLWPDPNARQLRSRHDAFRRRVPRPPRWLGFG